MEALLSGGTKRRASALQGTVTGKYQWDDSKKSNADADKAVTSGGERERERVCASF